MAYATINVEGGIFPPDLLERISAGDASIPGQKPSDFGVPSSRHLIDEIQRSFQDAQSYWTAFNRRLDRSRQSHTTLTRQDWATKFFELLGFPDLEYQRSSIEAGGTLFQISHRTTGGDNAPPVHIVSVDEDLDRRAPATRRTPHSTVQDFLNRSEALWGIVTNGTKLRLLRDSARLAKPTYLEFDIQGMIEGNAYSEFTLLYRILHKTRLPGEGSQSHECLLEEYFVQGVEEGSRVRDKLRDGVKQALEILGTALVTHPDNAPLREQFRQGHLDETGYYRQLLIFVYRMLFLMVVEERKLLFTGTSPELQAIYDRYYSIDRLRDRAERYFADDTHGDLWESLRQTFRLFREQNATQQLDITPLNGELFGHHSCPDIENASCSNNAFLRTLRQLSTFDDNGTRHRVNYSHLDVEEFGSVYESLLDYRPVLETSDGHSYPSEFQLVAGTERKQTGSYYTPPELVRELVDSALVPVMQERLAEAKTTNEKAEALLALRVCDPAAGSGHFLLAAARRIARELAKVRTGEEEPPPPEYRASLRDVVRSCLYAVDKNPLAVDLCKVALWIESHTAGLPLGFMDNRIKCGDSLIGVSDLAVLDEGIPDDAYKPVTGDDRKAATHYRGRNRRERTGQHRLGNEPAATLPTSLVQEFLDVGSKEERNPAEVRDKEDRYQELRGQGTPWWEVKRACDLWTYAFFAPLQMPGPDGQEGVPTTDDVRNSLHLPGNVNEQLIDQAKQAARNLRFFHWPLEFPEVFQEGGFDVVLGNPPWGRIKLQEKEFFGTRDREIADAPNKAARNRLVHGLAQKNPTLAQEFARAVHESESVSQFVRGSNRFPLTGRGDINTYSIFSETARGINRPEGRVGLIVPSGIATDDTNKQFFSDLVENRSLVSLYDFENREGVFPGTDNRNKFCLLTIGGTGRPNFQAEFAFFLRRTEQLQDDTRLFPLSPKDFSLFNPNTRTCPVFRTRRDMEITRGIYERHPALVVHSKGEAGQTWPIKYTTMFHMSNDSHLFRNETQLAAEGFQALGNNQWKKGIETFLPLYEGKMVQAFDHRAADTTENRQNLIRQGQQATIPASEKERMDRFPVPRYLVKVDDSKWLSSTNWIIGYKSVTSVTNTRTMIAAILPRAGVGHSLNLLPIITHTESSPLQACLIIANLNSMPFDFVARQKVGGNNFTWYLLEQLPFIEPDAYWQRLGGIPAHELVRDRVLELTYTAYDLESFAVDLGYDGPPFQWDEDRRHRLKCEQDAIFAHMYQLDREDLEWILDAPEPSASFPGLKRNELQQFGEYRTQRYVLQAYDQISNGRPPNLEQ